MPSECESLAVKESLDGKGEPGATPQIAAVGVTASDDEAVVTPPCGGDGGADKVDAVRTSC